MQAPYAFALAGKNGAYDRGWLRARELAWPVVSVGNLSVGGAGKTPFVIELARLLGDHGVRVDVLSRGYGRRSELPVERVQPEGDARRFGDEPLLIARAGVPVYVGASRWAAGLLAEWEAGETPGIHLLDDGFQHRRLHREVDIVLLHPSDAAGCLLPAGRLREPLHSLRRAHFVVLRQGDMESEEALHRAGIAKPVWRVCRSLVPPPGVARAAAFSGIAHPREFFEGLRAGGMALADTFAFRDHHVFRPRELRALAQAGKRAGALVTTEKDWVRLPAVAREELARAAPLYPVPLRAQLLDAEARMAELLPLLSAMRE